MMGHKICFSEEIWIIIPKLSLLLLLIWSPVSTFWNRRHTHTLFLVPINRQDLDPTKCIDGWMTCDFTSFFTVFQSYQDDVRMIMKGCVQWNAVYGWEDFTSSEDQTQFARSVGQHLTHSATGAPDEMCTVYLQINTPSLIHAFIPTPHFFVWKSGEHPRFTTGRYPVWQHTFLSLSAFPRREVVSYWQKYVHEILVNSLGGLSLPRKSVVRVSDHPKNDLRCLPWT